MKGIRTAHKPHRIPPPADPVALAATLEMALERIANTRALHVQEYGTPFCAECGQALPCGTVRALTT